MPASSTALNKENLTNSKPAALTPMMQQYFEIKTENQDAILFYRLGDFYEMFYDDAVEASRLLDLTLTTRNKNSADPVPLCGVPHHAAEGYIGKLIKLGKKVVICEQTEDPKKAKGLVKREVTRVVSPGVVLEEQSLSARTNNFLLCFVKSEGNDFATVRLCDQAKVENDCSAKSQSRKVAKSKDFVTQYVCAVCDVSTGSLEYFSVSSFDHILDEVARLQIREIFYPEQERQNQDLERLKKDYPHLYQHAVSDLYQDNDYATDLIKEHYKVQSLEALSLKPKDSNVKVLGLLLGYLKENKILTADLLQQPILRNKENYLLLDEASVRNLELFKTLRDEHHHGTLLWHLDFCQTSMGSRRMAEYIRSPLMDISEINERLDAVEELLEDKSQDLGAKSQLKNVSDLERLANKFIIGSGNARDAMSLKESFLCIPALKESLKDCKSLQLRKINQKVHDFSKLVEDIERTLLPEPPFGLKDGGLIAQGVNAELDELREIEKSGKGTIVKMEALEKEKTGISSLKIRYNNVFGYYIEITHTHKDKVPKNYIRKQTLTNAERYITDELKKYESKVLGASERIKTLEYELFCQLRETIKKECVRIKETASAISILDVLQSFAVVSQKFNYTRPKVTKTISLNLKGARHPILERLQQGDHFVPNDIRLNNDDTVIMIITGPNMAGKSTMMRMTALITIMAQMGCFVPCDDAEIGICDRVFTRVGAHDHLQKGMSTFMVEMVETAKILREATGQSLILLDEIGRGTSTFDGLSIAWAVAEDLHDRLAARTLFATHYHELCDLADQKQGVKNYHMSVKEWNHEIIFLRKLKSGGTNRSYGVAVASMAGLPTQTVLRAKEMLKLLELKDMSFQADLQQKGDGQMSLFDGKNNELFKKINDVNINQMTPLEALQFLAELKQDL